MSIRRVWSTLEVRGVLLAILTLGTVAAVGHSSGVAQTSDRPATSAQMLEEVFADFFEEYLELHPTFATTIGDNRFNDRLTIDISAEHRQKRRALFEEALVALGSVEQNGLSDRQRLHRDVFEQTVRLALEGLDYDDHLFPVLPTFSLPFVLPEMGSGDGAHPFAAVADYEDFLSRMGDFEVWVDTAIANLAKGRETGIAEPRILIEKALPQLQAQLVGEVEKSAFYRPIVQMPDDFSSADRARLERLYRREIQQRLLPAYKRLQDYLLEEYLPASRSTISASDLPWGRSWYRYLVRFYTTSDLAPAQIFQLGLDEIERITREMERLRWQTGFAGDLESFRRQVAADASHYYTSREEILSAYAKIRERVEARLPKLFGRLPELDFEVRTVPEHRSRFAPGAYYESPKPDGSRPGIFWVNASRRFYPKLTMDALFLHEAVPGHHLQIALARQQQELPGFLRFGYYGAFSEGWALYCESLGKKLGLYRDPLSELGRLQFELGRASRLVADVGIHERGWTREQAVAFLSQRGLAWAVSEIDRYTEMPGQGLAYTVGARKFSELRSRAEQALKKRFDPRRFHDALHEDGPMPLGILEQKMERWIASERSSRR